MNRFILCSILVLMFMVSCAHLPAEVDKVTGKPSEAITTWGGDARDNQILNRVGSQLARASELGADYYHFKLILTQEINAFTFSGGYIYLFLGMAEIMETEDELAAVLAHEIAHSEKRHVARYYDWEFPLHLFGEVVPLVTLGMVPNPITLGLSRAKEAQADEVGLRLMVKAGYCPKGMESLMEKFNRIFSLVLHFINTLTYYAYFLPSFLLGNQEPRTLIINYPLDFQALFLTSPVFLVSLS